MIVHGYPWRWSLCASTTMDGCNQLLIYIPFHHSPPSIVTVVNKRKKNTFRPYISTNICSTKSFDLDWFWLEVVYSIWKWILCVQEWCKLLAKQFSTSHACLCNTCRVRGQVDAPWCHYYSTEKSLQSWSSHHFPYFHLDRPSQWYETIHSIELANP